MRAAVRGDETHSFPRHGGPQQSELDSAGCKDGPAVECLFAATPAASRYCVEPQVTTLFCKVFSESRAAPFLVTCYFAQICDRSAGWLGVLFVLATHAARKGTAAREAVTTHEGLKNDSTALPEADTPWECEVFGGFPSHGVSRDHDYSNTLPTKAIIYQPPPSGTARCGSGPRARRSDGPHIYFP